MCISSHVVRLIGRHFDPLSAWRAYSTFTWRPQQPFRIELGIRRGILDPALGVLVRGKTANTCHIFSPSIPRILNSFKRRLDGQTPKSSLNRCGIHPGSLAETTGARAPSHTGGVKRDRPTGEPLGRAIGGQIHRTREGFPWGA